MCISLSCGVFVLLDLHDEAKRGEVLLLAHYAVHTDQCFFVPNLAQSALLGHLKWVVACDVLPVLVHEVETADVVTSSIVRLQVPDRRSAPSTYGNRLLVIMAESIILKDWRRETVREDAPD